MAACKSEITSLSPLPPSLAGVRGCKSQWYTALQSQACLAGCVVPRMEQHHASCLATPWHHSVRMTSTPAHFCTLSISPPGVGCTRSNSDVSPKASTGTAGQHGRHGRWRTAGHAGAGAWLPHTCVRVYVCVCMFVCVCAHVRMCVR